MEKAQYLLDLNREAPKVSTKRVLGLPLNT